MKKDTSVAITTFPTDGSLPPQHMTEGGSTKDRQEKCLALHRRQEAYKKFFADVSQISDGRSWEMFRLNICPPLLVVSETKIPHLAKEDGVRATTGHSTTTTWIDNKSKNRGDSSRRRSVDLLRVSSDYRISDSLQSESVPGVGYHDTACASETQPSWIGRQIPVENDDGSDDHAIVMNEDTSQDPKNALSSLAMTCSTLSASCTNLSAKAVVGSNFSVRKKHRPLHRSLPNNGSVMGIIRPSRYSQGDAQLNSSLHSYLIKPSRYSQGDAQLNSSMHSYLIKPSRYSQGDAQLNLSMNSYLIKPSGYSEGDTQMSSSMHSYQSYSSTHSNPVKASWIPLGVNFHSSTEICVFEPDDDYV